MLGDFLDAEWIDGTLLRKSAWHAFSVRRDRSSPTQSDIDDGRPVYLVGLAVLAPAEFTVIRAGQILRSSREPISRDGG